MADIAVLTGSENLAQVITKVNEVIARMNNVTIGNEALGVLVNHVTKGNNALDAKVNSASIGNTALGVKMTELYDNLNLPSEEPEAEEAPEIPEDEIEVTIAAVPRTFTFNVAAFNFEGEDYVSSQVVADLAEESGDAFDAAEALIIALVAAGSVIIEGEGHGVLTETT